MKKNFKLLLIPALVFSCVLCITAETAKAQVPANDLCADAIGPLAVPSTTAGTTVGATIDNLVAPFCGTGVTSPGVWYTVMGTGNTMTVSTCNLASYDNKISVYCADCALLICVGGIDDALGCGLTSEISFCSVAGAEYKVLVHGFGGASGTFNLTITDDGIPCAGAVGCPVAVVPTMTTQAVTNIGTTTATGNGNIADLGFPNPTAHGVVWNTTGTPTLADDNTDEGSAGVTGAFTSNMTGLSPNTTYYVRAYATNTEGTAYGNEVSFITTTPVIPALSKKGIILFMVLISALACWMIRRRKLFNEKM